MAQVARFRRFKIPALTTQFFSIDDSRNETFAEEDLARSGLTMEDLEAYTSAGTRTKEGSEASYCIPYFDLKGRPLTDAEGYPAMYRVRMKFPEFSREQRYTQPPAEQLAKLGLPPYIPYVLPKFHDITGEEIICAEGEKKAASIIKLLNLPAFGIGGCWLWRNPDGSGGIHPWIRDLIRTRGATTVTIVPDGDIRRYDIAQAYGNFARALENEGVRVKILEPPGKIDDLLVQWGAAAREGWGGIEPLSPEHLVQSPASLIKEFGLAFRAGADGKPPTVHQHISNVLRLMEEHNAFPKVWRNLDINRTMVGESVAEADLTEVQICQYFQHNLGFDKVNPQLILKAVQALAKKNARSPFLEYVRGIQWDGIPRLATWISRLWGIEDSDYIREISSKWLISACARMDKPGTKIDWMLVAVGPQKTGKTTMPKIMFKDHVTSIYGDQNDKDLHLLMHSALCVGFDELDTFSRRESSMLKALITRNEDAFRPPYGASVEVFPRRFTLYGCGNCHDFLQYDASGYRRYAVIEVPRILDFDGLASERDQLWAEAWQLYRNGGIDFWEVADAGKEAERFVISNPMEDKIEEFLARKQVEKCGGSSSGTTVYFKMGELLMHLELEKEYGSSAKIRDIASILTAKGVHKPEKASRHPDTKAVAKWYTYEPLRTIEP
jgi:hypothetical protein